MPNNNNNDNRSCLHCHSISSDIQVRCDECDNYVCEGCHWCHEFQGNHEIRVCGFCDVFYCKECDEMDQCVDCLEVVCGSCASLLSCKFCGGGLCEECATACGRCGIVLCRRDAKFAVECDTCRLSYCLVCLAGTPKDPCVRCGHRPSKRMEQLVHLRLKSIYKAFSSSSNQPGNTTTAAAAAAAVGNTAHTTHTSNGDTNTGRTNNTNTTSRCTAHQQAQEKADAAAAELLAELQEEEAQKERKSTKKKKKKKLKEETITECSTEEPPDESTSTHNMESKIVDDTNHHTNDPLEDELAELVQANDTEGLERLLLSIKGVPGMGALRKLAKKALKRIRADHEAPTEESSTLATIPNGNAVANTTMSPTTTATTPIPAEDQPPLGPEEMLRLISDSKRSRGGFECVMHMAPSIVGWVIGKGGQRIRDMMDESGARIWIDQDSMSSTAPRIVYVSGQRSNVDEAVAAIQELISAAPAVASPRTPIPIDGGADAGMASAPAIPEDTVDDTAMNIHKNTTLKPRCKTKLTCEPRYVPLLIGRRGWTIKNIQDTTGAKVDIDQTVSPRQITISGREDAVEEAKLMVEDVLSYPHAHPLEDSKPNEETTIPDQKPEAKAAPPPKSTTPPSSPSVRSLRKTVETTTTPIATERRVTVVEKRSASPPSSLIMNHDVKSTVSVSSSLSSTPEPSSRKSNPTVTTAASTLPPNNGFPPQSPMVAGGSPMYHNNKSPFPNQMPFMSSPHISPRMNHTSVVASSPPAFGQAMGGGGGRYPIPPTAVPNYIPPPGPYTPVLPMGCAPMGWNPGHPPPPPPPPPSNLMAPPPQQPQQSYYSPDTNNNTAMMQPNSTPSHADLPPIGASSLLPRSMPKDLGVFPTDTSTSDAKVVDSLFGGDDSSTKELILSGLKGLGLGGSDSDGLWTAGAESSLFSWGDTPER